MLTVADRGEGVIKFAKILLTSYVNAPFAVISRLYINILIIFQVTVSLTDMEPT